MTPDSITVTELILRLLLAAGLGGLIGIEREYHGRPAGLRTHILVCLGSAIIMASAQIFQDSYASQGAASVFRIDPGRIAAGVVTGIGFLGAGAILRSHDMIRGLTTAACIWFVAGIGIVVGCGLYLPATLAALLAFVLLVGLDPVGHHIPAVTYSAITIVSEVGPAENIESLCREILKKYPVVVQNTSILANKETGRRELNIYVRSRGIRNKHEVLKEILALKGIIQASWE